MAERVETEEPLPTVQRTLAPQMTFSEKRAEEFSDGVLCDNISQIVIVPTRATDKDELVQCIRRLKKANAVLFLIEKTSSSMQPSHKRIETESHPSSPSLAAHMGRGRQAGGADD